MYNFNDPKEEKQNVTFRFVGMAECQNKFTIDETRGGEKDEVDNIKFIPIQDLDKYNWAFNHKDLIKEIFNCYIK